MQQITAFAPGRVELLGNHTDYNEGYVLSAAIHYGVSATGGALEEPVARVNSEAMDGTVEVPLDALTPRTGGDSWANYALGVAAMLRGAGHALPGFSLGLTSDLPVGAGLSSSAAVEVATATFLKKLAGLSLDPLELAKLCRRAENEFVGMNCGLLDQVSSVFGKAQCAVCLDCRRESVRNIPFPADLALLVTHSGVKHALVSGEYNERREQCFEAARLLGVLALRDASRAMLDAARPSMPDKTWRRASHIVGENDRVLEGIHAMENADGEAFGRLMFASHESSRLNFENSTPELDALVDIACGISGVLGSRLTGGGFGGATVSLILAGEADRISGTLADAYHARTGHTAVTYLCRIADGAH